MSLLLGNGAVPSRTTGRERMVLQSSSESNMIWLQATDGLPTTKIVFLSNQAPMFSLGRSFESLVIEGSNNLPVATFAPALTTLHTSCAIHGGLTLGSSLEVASNLTVRGGVELGALTLQQNLQVLTSNLAPAPFTACNVDQGRNVFSVSSLGSMFALGSVGVGTAAPRHPLHVEGYVYTTGDVRSGSNLYARSLRATGTAPHSLFFSCNEYLEINTPAMILSGDLYVRGAFAKVNDQTDRLFVTERVQAPTLVLSNVAPKSTTLQIFHSNLEWTTPTPCNMASVFTQDAMDEEWQEALTINPRGWIGIGTTSPAAALDLRSFPRTGAPSHLLLAGDGRIPLCITSNANIGIGTLVPRAHMHVYGTSLGTHSLCLLEQANLSDRPYLSVGARETPTPFLTLTGRGRLVLGKTPTPEDIQLDVNNVSRFQIAQTSILRGTTLQVSTGERSISLENVTSLCNANMLHGSNLTISQLTTTSNLVTGYFRAQEITLDGLTVSKIANRAQFAVSDLIVPSCNVIFSPCNAHFFQSSLGRVRIYADPTSVTPAAAVGTPGMIGLHVFGPSNTALQVTGRRSTVRLSTDTSQMDLWLDTDQTFSMAHMRTGGTTAITPVPFRMSPAHLSLMQHMVVTSNNLVGIGLTAPSFPLHVRGNAFMEGNLGIGDASFQPTGTYKLEVKGNTYAESTFVENNLLVGGQGRLLVGAANDPTLSSYRMWVRGNVGMDSGNIVNAAGTLLIGNVGIGTFSPAGQRLWVDGPAIFSSSVTVRGLLAAEGAVSSLSDQKIKANLRAVPDALEKVCSLTGYTYDRIDMPPAAPRECGLIAQDVQRVLPEVVAPSPRDPSHLTLAYGNMAALFVEAIKEMREQIRGLEHQVARLAKRCV